jgi:branched-chain amino acid transport system permease protein
MARARIAACGWPAAWVAAALVLLRLPAFLSAGVIFNLGLVLIFFIAALGLHLLVNWAGELSLAHGTVLGLASLSVAAISADHNINPLAALPAGIAVGAACGLVMALVAARVSGFYVAIVTLAVSVAINAYFFTQSWLVGGGSIITALVPLGPFQLITPTQIYPVLAVTTVLFAGLFRALSRSKFRRALLTVKQDRAVAASHGIPVRRYRVTAYIVSGAAAGLAGALFTAWVGAVSPESFPQQLSFTYLIAVVLAGSGSLFAVAEMSLFLEGFQVFISSNSPFLVYLGPVGFVLTLTRFPGGLSQQNRNTSVFLRSVTRRLLARVHPHHAPPGVPEVQTDRAVSTERV